MDTHVSPDIDQINELFAHADDTPVVMLNLNRYREWAQYPPDHPDVATPVSGHEAYLRYGIVAHAAIQAVGGRIMWGSRAHEVVIGCAHDRYDEVIAVWYPSRAAFMRLSEHPGYLEAHVHREAGIEHSTLLACDEPFSF